MKYQIVTLLGKQVQVVPDTSSLAGGCDGCVFREGRCPSREEEKETGALDCMIGNHHYEEAT